MVDGALVEKTSRISLDSARALLGADPLAVPGAPIRTMYRAREIGYSAVVIVEQALDSSTVIEVVNGRRSPAALDRSEERRVGKESRTRGEPASGKSQNRDQQRHRGE